MRDDEVLYRGIYRLRKNNREDETVYRFLQNLPSGVSKNDIIKKALLEYIRNQTYPEQKQETGEIKRLEKQLSDMENRLIKGIYRWKHLNPHQPP